jgi:hypothetical protein
MPELAAFPDYSRCIVNLMSSIALSRGAAEVPHPPLDALPWQALGAARNLLLLVIDGLGHDYLTTRGRGSCLHEHTLGSISTVAPATTAAAIPTFLTAVPPARHGFTGWFGWYQELACVTTVLPYHTRHGGLPLAGAGIDPGRLSGVAPLSRRLPVACHMVAPAWIADSPFNRAFAGASQVHPYDDMAGMFRLLRDIITARARRRYLYAYWPKLDSLAHEHGIVSTAVARHFAQLDHAFRGLLAALAGSDTQVIVTADHGFVDIAEDHHIHLHQHPALAECLSMPLCGEPRLAYCYVHADKATDFEQYLASELADQIQVLTRRQALAQGLFGPGEAHPGLAGRIGDYVLVLKEGWLLKDRLGTEREYHHVGAHGGLSEAELRVPLVAVAI